MQIQKKIHNQLRIQNISFVLLLLAAASLLAYISNEHYVESDLSFGDRNTLSKTSIGLLNKLDKPIHFSVYATDDEAIREPVNDVINRYRRFKSDITVEYINPELEPVLARELGISMDGEVIIDYGGRDEHVTDHNEQSYTNTLQRLARNEQRWLSFISGHGERDPNGIANHDLSELVKILTSRGITSHSLNLAEQPQIPDNTAVLVITGPQVDFLPGELTAIANYIDSGGNLLWLADSGPLFNLEPLAAKLGIRFQEGVIVDPTTQVIGIADPRVALITNYPRHSITDNFNVLTLFPFARAIEVNTVNTWESSIILSTLDRSWAELGELEGDIEFNKDIDLPGPLVIGAALTRQLNTANLEAPPSDDETESGSTEKTQRVVVIGNGDFLSNTYLGNGGNLELGLNIINWLSHDDKLIAIPPISAPDIHLNLSPTSQAIIGLSFLLFIPLIFIATGVGVWLARRNR